MHHARQHAETRIRERRQRLAHEAARLMAEAAASATTTRPSCKAAARLGIARRCLAAAQPRDRGRAARIPAPVPGRRAAAALRQRREAALRGDGVLRRASSRAWSAPCSTAPPTPMRRSRLHLFSDDPDAVAALPRRARHSGRGAQPRRLRLERERSGDFPVWLFSADDVTFDLTVLPLTTACARRRCPASTRSRCARAALAQLRALLAADEIAGYESRASDARRGAASASLADQRLSSADVIALRRRRCRSGADGRSSFSGSFCCSSQCATQPAVRAIANITVNISVGMLQRLVDDARVEIDVRIELALRRSTSSFSAASSSFIATSSSGSLTPRSASTLWHISRMIVARGSKFL